VQDLLDVVQYIFLYTPAHSPNFFLFTLDICFLKNLARVLSLFFFLACYLWYACLYAYTANSKQFVLFKLKILNIQTMSVRPSWEHIAWFCIINYWIPVSMKCLQSSQTNVRPAWLESWHYLHLKKTPCHTHEQNKLQRKNVFFIQGFIGKPMRPSACVAVLCLAR
jgi:hypothetical protein